MSISGTISRPRSSENGGRKGSYNHSIKMVIERLHDYGVALQNKGDLPFPKLDQSLQEQAGEWVNQAHHTGYALRSLATDSEDQKEGEELKNIAIDFLADVAGLQAVVDMVTGELPGFVNPNKSSAEIGMDFIRTSEYLQKLADRLEKLARSWQA